jgi:hypothetical protein
MNRPEPTFQPSGPLLLILALAGTTAIVHGTVNWPPGAITAGTGLVLILAYGYLMHKTS